MLHEGVPSVCHVNCKYLAFGTVRLCAVHVIVMLFRTDQRVSLGIRTSGAVRTGTDSTVDSSATLQHNCIDPSASLDPQIYEELLETSLSGCRNPSIHGSNKGILMPPPSGPMDDLQSSKTGLAATRLLASLWITRPEKSDLPSRFSLFSVYERTSRRNVSWILRVFALSVRCTPRPASLKYASANACR